MAIYGYTRISTKDKGQENTRQINGIMDYLKTRNISTGIKFFNDEISGKTFKRPAFDQLKDEVIAGDEVIIYQMDRLGRDKEGIKEALEWFKKRGVIVRVLDLQTTLMEFNSQDEHAKSLFDMMYNILIEVYTSLAEAEVKRLSSRVKEGMAVAKAKGKQIGNTRKTVESLPPNFEYFYNLSKTKRFKKSEIAKQMGISEATLWRYCKLYEGQDVYKKNAEDMRNKRNKEGGNNE